MYETINGYPVQTFCDWYNEKYDEQIAPDDIEFELSYEELEYLSEKFEECQESF